MELLRPWKLATLAAGVALLIAGSRLTPAPDWDIPSSILMAAVAYVTAPWAMGTIVSRSWRLWPATAFLLWFGSDGCYAIYWSAVDPAALALMRDANAPASLVLYCAVGLLWMPRASLSEIRRAIAGTPGRGLRRHR